MSRYKKLVGQKRWETDEGIEQRVKTTFAEMCKVYGEENAVQMVRWELVLSAAANSTHEPSRSLIAGVLCCRERSTMEFMGSRSFFLCVL